MKRKYDNENDDSNVYLLISNDNGRKPISNGVMA